MKSIYLALKALKLLVIMVCGIFIFSGCGNENVDKISEQLPQKPLTGQAGDGNLESVIDYIRIDHGLPALAAVLVHDGMIVEKAVTGIRKIGNDKAVSIEDKWHIGSLTKSMTSTLAATLVNQGVINWDTTIVDVYPELSESMNNEYLNIKLEELLSHTSGMRANLPTLNNYQNSSLNMEVQRQKMVEEALMLAPEVQKGTFLYSNLGYMVAGAMMERSTGTSWEVLLENNIFNNLAMTSSGFGIPDINNNIAQPVGHQSEGSGWKANNDDNPAVMGPAGTVHSSLEDMGYYISAHLLGKRGNGVPSLLTANEFSKLHNATENSNYALGWNTADNILSHRGSNTLWLAEIRILSDKNTALFIVTNAADLQNDTNSTSLKAITELADEMIKRADAAF